MFFIVRDIVGLTGADLALKVHCGRTGQESLIVGFLGGVGAHNE